MNTFNSCARVPLERLTGPLHGDSEPLGSQFTHGDTQMPPALVTLSGLLPAAPQHPCWSGPWWAGGELALPSLPGPPGTGPRRRSAPRLRAPAPLHHPLSGRRGGGGQAWHSCCLLSAPHETRWAPSYPLPDENRATDLGSPGE